MTMIVWRTIDDNPWLGQPKQVALEFLQPPGKNARSGGPGPYSMADQSVVTKQLEIAGYSDIAFERIDAPVMVGRAVEDAVAFQLALGPASEIYREAGELAELRREEIVDALKEELAHYDTLDGIIMKSSLGESMRAVPDDRLDGGRLP